MNPWALDGVREALPAKRNHYWFWRPLHNALAQTVRSIFNRLQRNCMTIFYAFMHDFSRGYSPLYLCKNPKNDTLKNNLKKQFKVFPGGLIASIILPIIYRSAKRHKTEKKLIRLYCAARPLWTIRSGLMPNFSMYGMPKAVRPIYSLYTVWQICIANDFMQICKNR